LPQKRSAERQCEISRKTARTIIGLADARYGGALRQPAMAAELVGRFKMDAKRCGHSSDGKHIDIDAIANDYGYDVVF